MHLDLVHDFIWLSDLEAASDASQLDALNICHVLSVGCDVQQATNFTKSGRNVRYLALPDVRDEPEANLIRLFPQLLTFLDEASSQEGANRNVVVHCVHGQSRSAATLVAYLTSTSSDLKMNLEDALKFLKERCPRICINPGFLSQLHLYFNRLQYPAEYAIVMKGTATHEVCSSDDGCVTTSRGAVYILRCRGCRHALFHAQRTSPACTSHIPLPSLGDTDDSIFNCTIAYALAKSNAVTKGIGADSAGVVKEYNDPDLPGPDIREHLLIPRSGSSTLLDEYLDSYYHGYTSTLEYERQLVEVAVPLDLGNSNHKNKNKNKRKKVVADSEVPPDYGPALAFYIHPDGWIHRQKTEKAGANEWEILCPNIECATSIGLFRKGGLRICDGYLRTYLAALFMRKFQWEYV